MAPRKREPVSKKLRFEVFKRDSFTCQYCGKKAPDVVLHVDHIKPVAKGGGASILNLITSCMDCNSGKGARELSDDSALKKQQAQLEQLQSRREQLDMLIAWREGLEDLVATEVAAFNDRLEAITGSVLSEAGERTLRTNIKKFGLAEILECLDISANQYYRDDEDSVSKVVLYTYKIAAVRLASKNKPYLLDILSIRKWIEFNLRRNPPTYTITADLEMFHVNWGIPIQDIRDWARRSKTYDDLILSLDGIRRK